MKIINTLFLVCITIINLSCFQSQIKDNNSQPIEKKIVERTYSDSEKSMLLMPYSDIPLDKDYNTIFTELSKLVKVSKLEMPHVAFISQYKIVNLFNGLYEPSYSTSKGYDDELFLHSTITTRYYYSIPDKVSDNISSIVIYTYKTQLNQNESTLMISKNLNRIYANYVTRFDGMVSGISKEVGVKPKIYKTKFQDNININSNTYEPASIAIWETPKTKIFLLLRNDALGSISAGSLIYISKSAWSKYLEECKKFEKQKLEKNEKFSDGF